MKTMTCKQLGGACDKEFHAKTFDEMAMKSKEHGMQMFKEQEPAHLMAMQEMMKLMQDPHAMKKWMKEKEAEFDSLAED